MVKLSHLQLMKIAISILYVRSNNSSHQMVLYRPMDMHWTQRPPQPKQKVIVLASDLWSFDRIFNTDEVPFHFHLGEPEQRPKE